MIDLASDSEEEDNEEARFQEELKHVLEASKTESSSTPTDVARSSINNVQITNQPPSQSESVVSSFLSERAQMEKERRERQKRLRPQESSSSVSAQDDDDSEEPPAKRHQVSSSNTSFKRSNIPHDSSSKTPLELPTIEQVFWNGELRQTATQNAEPRKDGQATIRLTEVLGKVKFFLYFDPHFPISTLPLKESGTRVRYRFIILIGLVMDLRIFRSFGSCNHVSTTRCFGRSEYQECPTQLD